MNKYIFHLFYFLSAPEMATGHYKTNYALASALDRRHCSTNPLRFS